MELSCECCCNQTNEQRQAEDGQNHLIDRRPGDLPQSLGSMTETIKGMKKSYGKDWTWLAKLTLCRLIIFNKRRSAELKHVRLADYVNRPRW
jgi:hypothetical protein